MERVPKNLSDMADMAEQYLVAHDKSLRSKESSRGYDGKTQTKNSERNHSGREIRCFNCQGIGHKAYECRKRPTRYRYRRRPTNFSREEIRRCNYYNRFGHESKDCRDKPRPQSAYQSGRSGGSSGAHRVGCGVQVRATQLKEDEFKDNYECIETKEGQKLKVINGACMDTTVNDQMPVVTGKVGGKVVKVLRDTGCSGVIVKRDLVKEDQLTGEDGYLMTIDRTLLRAPLARIHIDTPYFSGMVEALCLRDPLYEVIICNVNGTRKPDEPNPNWNMTTAAVATRTQAKKQESKITPLKVAEVETELQVTRDKLAELQEQDKSLKKFAELKDPMKRGQYEVNFEKRRKILYRVRRSIDSEETCKQILVPKSLRRRVMEVAHDSMFGGHQGVKKTEDRISTNFYWPGIHGDVVRFCRSCDVCQKTISKGSVMRTPWEKCR